ncbi:hypothetical protein BJX68DRAFT_173551 [Aspergillus pseudodeflectus]|uniref:Uncharacterized protein n=1 Tax=Aspergillus pseudodeflectus TaxID=176178 RepID=A0ABR4JNB4_9EURO
MLGVATCYSRNIFNPPRPTFEPVTSSGSCSIQEPEMYHSFRSSFGLFLCSPPGRMAARYSGSLRASLRPEETYQHQIISEFCVKLRNWISMTERLFHQRCEQHTTGTCRHDWPPRKGGTGEHDVTDTGAFPRHGALTTQCPKALALSRSILRQGA